MDGLDATNLTGGALVIVLVVRMFLDYLRSRQHPDGSTPPDGTPSFFQTMNTVRSQVADLHEWHSVSDQDGVKLWLNKPSDRQQLLECLEKIEARLDRIEALLRRS